MPRPELTTEDLNARRRRAEEWRRFRRDYLFTQQRLADIIGISRRTVQQIEAGVITPHPSTLRLFISFKHKHEVNRDIKKRRS